MKIARSLVVMVLLAAAGAGEARVVGQGGGGPAGPAGPAPGGRGRGAGGPGGGVPDVPDNLEGFMPLFNGTNLNGWDGDLTFWRVENGTIVAESTPEKVVADNTFLIWRGGTLRNFELKVESRFGGSTGNSGIQVRSRPLTAPSPRSGGQPRPWGIAGYQVDLVAAGGAGNALLFEEAGRGFLARQGQITRRSRDGQGNASSRLIGTLGDGIVAAIKPMTEWNAYHVIGNGHQLTVAVNGRVSAIVLDEDPIGRAMEGLLALQMHVGQPFRVEFRNVYLKHLPTLP